MLKKEKKLIEFIEKNYFIIGIILISIIAFAVRVFWLDYTSWDYIDFLSPWFDELKARGGILALGNYPGDYNVPYVFILSLLTYLPFNKLHMIKFVSIVFDFLLAISSGILAINIKKSDNSKFIFFLTYFLVLFIPSVMFNGALWGQCDSIYATFMILSLYYLLKNKYLKSFVLLGISFSFKLQFIFILPLYVVMYCSQKKFSWLYFLIIPLVNMIMCLPSILAGNSLYNCFNVYFNQVKSYYNYSVLNFPNIYNLINGNPNLLNTVGILVALSICFMTLVYVLEKKVKWNNEKIITLGLWFIVILTFVLPGMHERYAYCAEVLVVIYYICYQKNLYLELSLIISSILTYSAYLFGNAFDITLLSAVNTVVIAYFTKSVFGLLKTSNEDKKNRLDN